MHLPCFGVSAYNVIDIIIFMAEKIEVIPSMLLSQNRRHGIYSTFFSEPPLLFVVIGSYQLCSRVSKYFQFGPLYAHFSTGY